MDLVLNGGWCVVRMRLVQHVLLLEPIRRTSGTAIPMNQEPR